MQRVSTTVIALVGASARACAEAAGAAANVRAVLPDQDAPPLDRAVEAWREAKGAHIPYLVHDADPLATVADAWVQRFDQPAGRGWAGEGERGAFAGGRGWMGEGERGAFAGGRGWAGELEVAVSETVARWRARSIELPDYYLVLDAESLGATTRHWYLGVLHRAAPVRVVPVAATPTEVIARLSHLPAGRWWPDLDQLLSGIDRVVPDRA